MREPLAEERDAAAREAAVGLELRLARAAGADAAAEALEVLPHPAHPREVVLELRELDLELSLGADGVLGEDVEDQLRAVDDPRLERVLERPLLRRAELVVDDQHLCLGVAVRLLQLLELPLADVRARVGEPPVLDDPADRLDLRRPRQLLELGELVGAVDPLREHGDEEPTLGLGRPGAIGLSAPPSGGHYDSCHAHFRSRRPDARARRRALGEPPGTARDGARAEPPAR